MKDSSIIRAIKNLEEKNPGKIVKQVGGYIVVADSELDFSFKGQIVNRGQGRDLPGVYPIDEAIKLK